MNKELREKLPIIRMAGIDVRQSVANYWHVDWGNNQVSVGHRHKAQAVREAWQYLTEKNNG